MNAVSVELITRQRETVSRRLRETPLGLDSALGLL